MDLLAVLSDEILSPLINTLIESLVFYQEANELVILPSPTVSNHIYEVIDAVNGTHPGEEPPYTTATDTAASTSSTSSTPPTKLLKIK